MRFFANGTAVDGEIANTTILDTVFGWLTTAGLFLWNWIMTFIYTIVKFALNIVDFIQFFVQRLVGVDFWTNTNSTLADLGESDIIFRFMFSEEVLRVFRLIIIIAIVLLIVFSIIAIVKSEYSNATTGKGDKKGILTSSLKAIFLVVLIPVMLIFGLLASNAVLASILNAVQPDNNNLTIGGQIFVASAYGANRYRTYADDGKRYPATYSYTFGYNHYSVNGMHYYVVIGSDVVYIVPSEYDGTPDFNSEVETASYQNLVANPELSSLSNKSNSGSVYYQTSSMFETIMPTHYKRDNPLYAFVYYFPESVSGNDYTYYLAAFDESDGIDKLAKYHYLTSVLGADIQTSNLARYQQNGIWNMLPSINQEDNVWHSTSIVLDDCGQNHEIVQMAYNTWGVAPAFDDYVCSLEQSVTQNVIEWTSASGITLPNALYYTNNTSTWTRFDGGEYGFVPLSVEYEIMADFIDFMVRMGVQAYIVNSQSPLIDWSGVNENNYFKNEETGLVELCVNYADLGSVVYKPTNTDSEAKGAIYLMCLFDTATGRYVPIVPNRDYYNENGKFTFDSDFYNSNTNEEGLVIARGVFDSSYSTNPTIIEERYVDDDGNSVTSGTAVYVNITSGSESVNEAEMLGRNFVNVSFASGSAISQLLTGGLANDGSGVLNYTVNSDNILAQNFISSDDGFAVFRDSVFKETLPAGYSYSNNGDRAISVTYSSASNCVYANVNDTSNRRVQIILRPHQMPNGNMVMLVQTTVDGQFANAFSVLGQVTNLNQYSTSIYDQTGTIIATGDGTNILIDDYFNNQGSYNLEASEVYAVYNLSNLFVINPSSLLGLIEVNGTVVGQNATILQLTSSGYNRYRVWTGADQTGNCFDIYINNNKLSVIPYHIYGLTTQGSSVDVSGLAINNIVGYGGGNTYVRYNGSTYVLNSGTNNFGVNYFYLPSEEVTTFTERYYNVSFYDPFAYILIDENGNVVNADEIKNLKGEMGAISTTRFNYSLGNNGANIYDTDGNILYGIEWQGTAGTSYRTAYVYSNGEVILRIVVDNPSENTIQTLDQIIALQTVNTAVGEGEKLDLIVSLAYNNVDYSPVPRYTQAIVDLGDKIKPDNILFVQEKISKDFIAADINFNNGATAIRLHIDWFFGKGDVAHDNVYHLSDSSFVLDYNFNTKTGIALKNLYMPAQLNVIILLFATVLVFKILMQSVWGLIKRIYDITILFMVMPGFASTMPIDGGDRFAKWKDKLIKSVFSAYGVLIGLNVFFVLVPVIDNAVGNIFTYADLPSTIVNNFLFSRPDYLNELVKIMFILVALTLMQSLPELFSGLIGSDDVLKGGGETRRAVGEMTKDVGDVVSGRKLLDTVAPTGKDGKRHANTGALAQFIPGSALMSTAGGWLGDKMNSLRDALKEKEASKRGKSAATSPFAGGGGNSKPSDTSTSSEHASTSDFSSAARRISKVEENDTREFTGTNTNKATGFMDTEKSENEMAQFASKYFTETQNGKDGNAIYQQYEDASSDWVRASVNNAMMSGAGDFTVREKDLDEINKTLGEGFIATAYRTDEKNEITGESMWAVKIAKDTVGGINSAIDDANKVESTLMNNISGYDQQLSATSDSLKDIQKRFNDANTIVNTIDSQLSGITSNGGFEEFRKLSKENADNVNTINAINNDIKARKDENIKLGEQKQDIDNQIKELEAKYNIRERMIPGHDSDKDNWLREIKGLREKRTNIENTIALNNGRIDGNTIRRDSLNKKIDENKARIGTILGGKTADEVNNLVKQRETAEANAQSLRSEMNSKNLEYEQIRTQKVDAEKNLAKVREGRDVLIAERDSARAANYQTMANDAAKKYEAAIIRQERFDSLEKVVNSSIPQANKEKAINTFVNTYYKGASDADKKKLMKDLSTGAGIGKARAQTRNEIITQEAIATGAQTSSNRISKQHHDSPIKKVNDDIANRRPRSSGNGGISTGGSRPTGGAQGIGQQEVSASANASSNTSNNKAVKKQNVFVRAGKKVADTAKNIKESVVDTAKNVKENVVDFVKPKTQGDRLAKTYKKLEKAEDKPKIIKGISKKLLSKKMVRIASKSTKIREKADADYIRKVENITGESYNTVEEANQAAQKHTQNKNQTVMTDGRPVQVSNDHDAELLKAAAEERNKAYEKSKLNEGKKKNAETFEAAKEATKNYARKGVNKKIQKYQTKVDNAGRSKVGAALNTVKRKIVRGKPSPETLWKTGDKVRDVDEYYQDVKARFNQAELGDIDEMSKKEMKDALKQYNDSQGNDYKKSDINKAAKSFKKTAKAQKKINKAKESLRRSSSARAIDSLYIDNNIDSLKIDTNNDGDKK